MTAQSSNHASDESRSELSTEINDYLKNISHRPSFMVGLPIYLEFKFRGKKVKCRTIVHGWYHDEFFIIESPRINGGLVEPADGEEIIVRYILDGVVYGFKTMLVRKLTEPKRLLLLDFPDKVEVRVLRKHDRLQTMLPVQVAINSGKEANAVIIDLSAGGAMLDCAGSCAFPEDGQLRLNFLLPNGNEIKGLPGLIKSYSEESESIILRVEFQDPTGENTNIIEDFVNSIGRNKR